VLWVTSEPPDRSLGGGNIRQAALVTHLAQHVDITLLTAAPLLDDVVAAAARRVVEVPVPPLPHYRTKMTQRLASLFMAVAPRLTTETWINRRPRRSIRRRLRVEAPLHDVVVVNHQAMARILRRVRGRCRWVAEMHHIPHERLRQERPLARGGRQRWLLERDELKSRTLEAWTLANYDAAVVASSEDGRLLREAGHRDHGSKVAVVPNGVDLDLFRPSPVPVRPRIVFTASLQYGPNVDGAVWFAREIFPLVRARVPEAVLVLVGLRPAAEVRALAADPGIELHADVPSTVPYISAARVAVVPLRAGTGTRLKALEYFAAGRPVVGTTIGLEGLGVVDGVHALVRDDPNSMADAIVQIIEDDRLAATVAGAARRLVEDHFGWQTIAADYAAVLRRIAGPEITTASASSTTHAHRGEGRNPGR
jgi:glycosyltransferase involved in cell wall biosynthesis